jgi:hypothetical protein
MSSLLKKSYPELKNLWRPGEMAYFEYHCYMGHDSADAELWYRTHQPVLVVKMTAPGAGRTYNDRAKAGVPRMWRIRFLDGGTGDAFEDELYTDMKYWSRDFNPPSDEEIAAHRRTDR